jgi:acetyl-CoA acetyltransferase
MVDVAVVGYSSFATPREARRNEVEMLIPVIDEALAPTGLAKGDMGFVVSGSSDYLAGQPFAFVNALDAVGAWPPIAESHVEQDGAFALYEAWLRLQHGDIDTALVYGFGKSSPGDLPRVLALQMDPYTVAPLWPDSVSLAALQARLLLEDGVDERQLAEAAARSLTDAVGNPHAIRSGQTTADELLERPVFADPLRKHDCAPITDGCAAVVLATGDRARELSERPAWITGIDHRIEPTAIGTRDLTDSPSTRRAAEEAGVADGPVDVAELYAPFSSQELILRRALGLNGETRINPSGGALVSNPVMAAGLIRIGEAAQRIRDGEADRAIAHATSGPLLQHNLVCVLEGR